LCSPGTVRARGIEPEELVCLKDTGGELVAGSYLAVLTVSLLVACIGGILVRIASSLAPLQNAPFLSFGAVSRVRLFHTVYIGLADLATVGGHQTVGGSGQNQSQG
tara:strand:- start:120377 stop:120694 length:318 start_codon:yes stop_codon:yes gene_type:complete